MLLQGIRDDVRGGKALSQALDARREVFSRFYVNIVRAGEAGGALGDGAAAARRDDGAQQGAARDRCSSALIYPTILIFVAVASVMVLLIFVVPQFQSTFAQAGKALPLPTQIVIVVGTFLRNWWWAAIAGGRARRAVVSTARPQSGGAPRCATRGCCACRCSAT